VLLIIYYNAASQEYGGNCQQYVEELLTTWVKIRPD